MLVHLERHECAARLLLADHFSHAGHGLRSVMEIHHEIISVVPPQSVARQFSDPSETISEIPAGERAGDRLTFRRHILRPLYFSHQRRSATKAQIASTSPNGQAP
jgi:hypothetical protein